MKRIVLAALAVVALPAPASASTVEGICQKGAHTGATVKELSAGNVCKTGEEEIYVVKSKAAAEAAEHLTYEAEGIAKKPTVVLSNGTNLQLLKGTTAGTGNLVIGNEPEGVTGITGSNNLVVGKKDNVTSEYCVCGGESNTAESVFATLFGRNSTVGSKALFGAVLGGNDNTVGTIEETRYAATLAGEANQVDNYAAAAVGGASNTVKHEGRYAVAVSGTAGTIEGPYSVTAGGLEDKTTSEHSYGAVVGGQTGTASGEGAVVAGGHLDEASGQHAVAIGARSSTASGLDSGAFGAYFGSASGSNADLLGGYKNEATGNHASVAGGKELKATNEYEALL
jgi:hypothetical protein